MSPNSNIQTVKDLANLLQIDEVNLKKSLIKVNKQICIKEKNIRGKLRKIHCTKKELKKIQKQIYLKILKPIPVPNSFHGYIPKKSALTNAECHVGKRNLLKFDIENFFPSIHFLRVTKIFKSLGFNDLISEVLTKLTTADYFLPQGFSTSPKLAILCLLKTNHNLESYLKRTSFTSPSFYSDDVTISGQRNPKILIKPITKIFKQNGFKLKKKKTDIQPYFRRQEVTGILVNNNRRSIKNSTVKLLEAIIHNCNVSGPKGQIERFNQTFGAPKNGFYSTAVLKLRIQGKLNTLRLVNHPQYKPLLSRLRDINWSS